MLPGLMRLREFSAWQAPDFLERLRRTDLRLFGIPAVVETELLLGAEESRDPERTRLQVESFLLPFAIVPFDSACASFR